MVFAFRQVEKADMIMGLWKLPISSGMWTVDRKKK
jgi:hypothetical protein